MANSTSTRLQKVRDAIDALMDGGAVQSYEINGRQLSHYSLSQLMDLEKRLLGIEWGKNGDPHAVWVKVSHPGDGIFEKSYDHRYRKILFTNADGDLQVLHLERALLTLPSAHSSENASVCRSQFDGRTSVLMISRARFSSDIQNEFEWNRKSTEAAVSIIETTHNPGTDHVFPRQIFAHSKLSSR